LDANAIKTCMMEMIGCMKEGVPIRGYLYWSWSMILNGKLVIRRAWGCTTTITSTTKFSTPMGSVSLPARYMPT
jgi:hypothetical protein